LINIVSLNLITEANRVCEQQLRVAAILRFHVLVIQLSRIRLFSHRYWSLFSQSVVRSIYRSFTVDWFSVQNINNSFVLYMCVQIMGKAAASRSHCLFYISKDASSLRGFHSSLRYITVRLFMSFSCDSEIFIEVRFHALLSFQNILQSFLDIKLF
jgi:hypothetical protein